MTKYRTAAREATQRFEGLLYFERIILVMILVCSMTSELLGLLIIKYTCMYMHILCVY